MIALNRATFIGYVGRDPESRYTSSGKQVVNFSVAVTERWKTRDGEPHERTEWLSIVAWEKLAEICMKIISRGSLVYVEGKVTTREWEDREGKTRKQTEILASQVLALSGKAAQPNGESQDVPEGP